RIGREFPAVRDRRARRAALQRAERGRPAGALVAGARAAHEDPDQRRKSRRERSPARGPQAPGVSQIPVACARSRQRGHIDKLTIVIRWCCVNLLRPTWIVVLALAAGCAPSLATMQPAHVAPKGHMQVTTAVEVGIPTGTIGRIIDTGRTLSDIAQRDGMVTAEQERQLFDWGVNVAGRPTAFGYHFAAYYVPLDRLQIGLRYAGAGFRAGA